MLYVILLRKIDKSGQNSFTANFMIAKNLKKYREEFGKFMIAKNLKKYRKEFGNIEIRITKKNLKQP